MARFEDRSSDNVRGAFYVDGSCLDCDLCRNVAPNNFSRNAEQGTSYVSKQPETPEELALCREAVEGCCCESIGYDGERFDWNEIPPRAWPNACESAKQRCCDTGKEQTKRESHTD